MNSAARARPLSPHVGIYRWQISNTLSILHRFTGIALVLAFPALAYWLIALAGGEEAFRSAQQTFASPLGVLGLIIVSFAFFYHLLNGIRHLCWDLGKGFERRARHLSGWIAFLGAIVLTVALWSWLWWGGRS